MSPPALVAGGLMALGLGTWVAVLSLWERAVAEARAAWARYAVWAGEGLRELHLALTARDMLVRHLGLILVGFAIGIELGSAVKGGFIAVVAAAAPFFWMHKAKVKRRKALESQLDAALQTIANNMLATQNVVDGFAAVATHLTPPVSQEAELLVKDVKVGARIEEALAGFAERCKSQHVDAIVTALAIGLRTGGDLGKVLKKIATVVRETIRCEEMMEAKTSEGKTSAWIIGAMPALFAIGMTYLMPSWMEPLWNTTLGSVIVGIAALLDLIGVLLVLKISKIDP